MPSQFPVLPSTFPILPSLILLAARASALFQTGTSPAIQDPFLNPPPTTCPVLQDGATTNTFPWTHNPTCVDAVLPSRDAAQQHTGTHRQFCVYTNAAFNSGRGLSLVTTPETAAELTFEVFAPYFNDTVNVHAPWEVRDAEGKGKGLFATREVAAGDTLILKSPVLFVSKEVLGTPSRARRNALLRTAVEQLPEERRKLVMGLSVGGRGGTEDVGDVVEDLIRDIVEGNGIGMRVGDGSAHLMVVPEAARINHACRPNAAHRFNDHTLTFEVFSLRAIAPDEEIAISYGFSELPHNDRRTALESKHGFPCTCPLCSAPASNISASDARLQKITEVKEALPPAGPDALPKLIALLPELISLLDEEGLIVELPMYEEILAYTWSAFGIEERARKWGLRARDHWGVVAGRGSWDERRVGEFVSDVRAHYTWSSYEGEDPWEGVGKGHPWDEDEDEHDHEHDHEGGQGSVKNEKDGEQEGAEKA